MAEPHPFPDSHAPVGSGIYYAIRFAPQQRRSDLSLVNALYRSIADIPSQCSEASVAARKLQWWQEEMQRARRGGSQHPIAAAGTQWAHRHDLDESFLEPLFAATSRQIGAVAVADETELEHLLAHTGGVFGELMAVAGGAEKAQHPHARALGVFLFEAEALRSLGGDLRRDRILLPATRLREFGLSATELLDADDTRFTRLLQASIMRVQTRYHDVLQAMTPSSGMGPLLSLAALASRLLTLIERDGVVKLQRQRTRLTPLHKLWICWRCQRRLR